MLQSRQARIETLKHRRLLSGYLQTNLAVANDSNLDVLRAREDFQKLAKQWQGTQE